MNMNEYQQAALRTARSKSADDEIYHLLLGLCGEAGEIAEKTKKIIRDKNSDFSLLDKDDFSKELGDVLWHLAVLADYFDISLDEVASRNIAKLADRQRRGVIGGSGDNR
ncbi:nucleoside triphosphate pyrophosphohydrolase family protein [Candidatus Saccharibacteria bacterium]|jgi:NTP pyrophosphatase (non-canonical NTP hydrolase)|nr:nucleoside triphosphate pyrophosphohydrolase family protein [Candidatus Saccharibacteria bacterium]